MDNNQQDATVVQPTAPVHFTQAVAPAIERSEGITNLGINEPKTMEGTSVQSPFGSGDVSMTTAQPYGGPIVTTEVPHVANETGPNS